MSDRSLKDLYMTLLEDVGLDRDILMTKKFIVDDIGDVGFNSLLLGGYIHEAECVTTEGDKLYVFD